MCLCIQAKQTCCPDLGARYVYKSHRWSPQWQVKAETKGRLNKKVTLVDVSEITDRALEYATLVFLVRCFSWICQSPE